MQFRLKEIHWSIWKSLASRKKGFWQFILRRFISPDSFEDNLEVGEWLFYRRTKMSEMDIDFPPEFWVELKRYYEKWADFNKTFRDDEVLKTIAPVENDYLLISTSKGIVSFTFKSGDWELVFNNEEMIDWKNWLAYKEVIVED